MHQKTVRRLLVLVAVFSLTAVVGLTADGGAKQSQAGERVDVASRTSEATVPAKAKLIQRMRDGESVDQLMAEWFTAEERADLRFFLDSTLDATIAGPAGGYLVEPPDVGDCGTGSEIGIPLDTIYTAGMPGTCDFDGFVFHLSQDSQVTISTAMPANSMTPIDTTIQLVDCQSLEPLGCDDDSGPVFESEITGCLPGGSDYCVRIRAFSASSLFDYDLSVTEVGACDASGGPAVVADGTNACATPDTFNNAIGCDGVGMSPATCAAAPAVGACCTNGPGTQSDCVIASQGDCEVEGGTYLGDGTQCDAMIDCTLLLVTMDSLSAERTAGGVLLRWTTLTEIDNLGFRLLRERPDSTKSMDVIAQMIPGNGSSFAGASYEFLDNSKLAASATAYYVEAIDIFGKVTRHGPIAIDDGARKPGASRRTR